MNPSRKDIADLFSVVFDKTQAAPGEATAKKGTTAEQSRQLGAKSLTEGDYEKAIEHFRRAVDQRKPEDIAGRIDLAGAYEAAEMTPEALRQYEKALRARQDNPEPLLGLSQVYKRHARYRESIQHLQKALELEPHNAFLRFKTAEIYREVKDRESALTSARLAVLAAPTDPFYHYWIGDLLIEMGRFEEALEALKAALELSPGDDYLYLRAASAFWGAGRKQEAIKSVRLASDLDPDNDMYHGVLELLLNKIGLPEEASLEAKRSSKMDDYAREALRRFAAELGLEGEPLH